MKGNINKKVLCITDRDLKINTKEDLSKIKNFIPTHIIKLLNRKKTKLKNKRITLNKNISERKKYKLKNESKKIYYVRDNIVMVCQDTYGSTFEDELFFANIENKEISIKLLKIALCKSLWKFIENNELNFDKWKANIEEIKNFKTREKIKNMISKYDTLIKSDNENKVVYEKLFFSNLFLSYAENKKGEVALEILLNNDLIDTLIIPSYIKEGIEWLVK